MKKYCLKKKSFNEEAEKRILTTQEKEEKITDMLMMGNVPKRYLVETFKVPYLRVLALSMEVETKKRIIELLGEGKLGPKEIANKCGVPIVYVSQIKVKRENERMRRMKLLRGTTEDSPDAERR